MTHRRAPPPPAIGPSLRRRRVAGLVAATAVLASPRVASAANAAGAGEPSPPWRATFTAFCDTVVPADATTPSASALGIDRELLADIVADADAARLVDTGCRWLDAAVRSSSRGAFAAADEPARVAAVTRMAAQPATSAPARFYLAMRNSLFEAYYARPESWRGLALDRPPQPLGFYDAVR